MRVILFGATGMIGQGVLRECLLDPDVTEVLSVTRASTGRVHPKLRELVHADFFDFSSAADTLSGYDACFFCIGISVAGLSEAEYRRVTYDIALAAARVLVERSPRMTFIYVSGAGADNTGTGRVMWARVKGATENALRQLPFKAVYVIRPGIVQPKHGIVSRTRWYRVFYAVFRPVMGVMKAAFPGIVTTTEELGRAMLAVAKHGAPDTIVTGRDFAPLSKVLRLGQMPVAR